DKTPEGGAPILVGNVRASQVQAQTGQDNAWVPEPQGNALQFDGTDDCVKLCNDKLATTGDLTMEAWVNVGVGDGKDPHDSMCIIDYHRSEDSRCTLGLSRGAGGSGDDETLYKVSAGVWKQAVQTKNATVSPGEWTHLAAVYNATNALQLDGRGYVDCGNDATLDMTEAMTVEAWVTVAATPPKEPQVILSKWRAVAEEQSWRLYIDTDGKPCFETLDHNRRVTRVKSSEPLEAGRAYHLAGVFAASPKEEVALTLNGTSDYVRIPNDDAINFGKDDDFTVAAWIKPAPEQQDTAHSANSIIEKWSGRGSYPYAIRYLNQADTVDRGRLWAARSDRKISASVRSEKRLDDGA
ncbi:MAG: hypothetical protein GWN58_41330, partial [Anaerolineae bacterium]|nr:hypothetical protein [Anaerolineae bacterium]